MLQFNSIENQFIWESNIENQFLRAIKRPVTSALNLVVYAFLSFGSLLFRDLFWSHVFYRIRHKSTCPYPLFQLCRVHWTRRSVYVQKQICLSALCGIWCQWPEKYVSAIWPFFHWLRGLRSNIQKYHAEIFIAIFYSNAAILIQQKIFAP